MRAPNAITSSSGCATSITVVPVNGSSLSFIVTNKEQSLLLKVAKGILRNRMHPLQAQIEQLYSTDALTGRVAEQARRAFQQFREALTRGEIRAAEKNNGRWQVNAWVKQGILLGFKLGKWRKMTNGVLSFVNKAPYPPRHFRIEDKVRVVPGGSSVRTGVYIAPGVICMPPMYANVGAYIDEGTMVDSHALVGSCAQVGKRVHLSAASQIGGVLEPVNA